LQVDIYKPVTSKMNNSETYITCFGFRGISEPCLHSLLQHVGKETFDNTAMLPRAAMPERFMHSVVTSGKFFAKRTQEALEHSLSLNNCSREWSMALEWAKGKCTEKWITSMQIRSMPHQLRLSPSVRC
jgi:hypothetical protein